LAHKDIKDRGQPVSGFYGFSLEKGEAIAEYSGALKK
jgi:hypothetical protein